jgi:aryl-alcohol dehydrogenase-like predicted oxidoreductase
VLTPGHVTGLDQLAARLIAFRAMTGISRHRPASAGQHADLSQLLSAAAADDVLPAAREAGVGIIARVPLASGLLSGEYDETTASRPTTTGRSTGTVRRSTL